MVLSSDFNRQDEFLRSMTFASGGTCSIVGGMMCGCDECGPSSRDDVPPTIRNAINEHLQKRRMEQQNRQLLIHGSKRLHIRQNRELVKREDGISLWRLDLPLDDGHQDPIVEHRNNHRILFVKKLRKTANVYSIGKGIIGSAAEEVSRTRVHWKEGSAYLLPQCQGIACGWTQKKAEGAAEEPPEHVTDVVVLYSLKVSPDILSTWNEGCDIPVNASGWVRKSYELFHRYLAHEMPSKHVTIDTINHEYAPGGIELSHEDSTLMSAIIELAVGLT